MKKILTIFVVLSFISCLSAATSQWVHYDSSGKLAYFKDDLGNRILDFSYAGYHGGGFALPNVPVKVTISPVSGDDTASIQNAINQVAALTPDANGFRGAVLLKAGTYDISGRINLSVNGVVLRGEGNNSSGTVLSVSKASGEVINVAGSGGRSLSGSSVSITDTYVPLAATAVTVSSSSGYSVGDQIVINRPWTQSWIDAIGMNGIWSPNSGIYFERTVTAVSGNQVSFDIPLGNPIEQKFVTGNIQHYTDSGRVQQCGVENIYLLCIDTNAVGSSRAVMLNNCRNCWAHDITCDTFNNGFSMGPQSKFCTIQDCDYVDGQGGGSARPGCYNTEGEMCLYQRCATHGIHGAGDGSWILTTQGNTAGPDVFFRLQSFSDHTAAQLHARWAASQLIDGISGSLSSVSIQNLGTGGNGHGWTAGYSIAYNCKCSFSVEQPTVDHHYNWVIGGIGKINPPGTALDVGPGTYDATNSMLTPGTLYLAQLKERLGSTAVENMGYQLFDVSVTPASSGVIAGNSATFTVATTDTNDLNPSIVLSASGLPAGASASFSPSTLVGGSSSTLTLSTSSSTPAGSYTITVTGTCGNLSHSDTVTLTVSPAPDFSISATPSSQTVTAGGNTTYTINLGSINGFTGTVSLSANGLPAGATASFSATSVVVPGSSTLTVTTSASTPAGTYPITITGTSGSSHNTTVSLVVNGVTGVNIDTNAVYQVQNVASRLVLNNQGSLTNGSKVTQWSSASTSQNLQWKFIPTSNGYYQINSVKSGLDAVVQGASTAAGAGIIQWSFGSSGDDQWKPTANSDGSVTFVNLKSGLVLGDPGSSTSTSTQMDQETANGGSNQKWNLLKQ